jgi:lysophospholipase L1-like esterase
MKKINALILLSILLILSVSMKAPKPTRVIFFGDSITEAGVGPKGYITMIGDSLKRKGVAGQYDLVGAGVGGNKIYDLYLRMEDDVLNKNPDVVIIYIGVNDVWHKAMMGTGTDPDKFAKFYTAIIQKLQAKNIKVVLCTPAVIGEKKNFVNQQDGDLNHYSQIIRDLGTRFNCPLCDLRKIFTDYDSKNNPNDNESGILTVDKVHLNDKGNTLVADLLLPLIQ